MSPQIIGYFSEKQDFAPRSHCRGMHMQGGRAVRGLLDYWAAV